MQGGLLMGIVVDSNKPDYVQGDFLVRGLVGADPATGKVAVAADVHPGQVVRLHARDAASADRDLREALGVPHGGAGRPRAGGRAACSPATAAGATCSPRPTTTPTRSREALLGAPGRGLLRRGRDRPGRRRALPAQLHRDRRRLPVGSRASWTCADAPPWSRAPRAASGTAIARALARAAPRSSSPAAAPTCSSRSPPRPAAARSPATSPTPPTSTGCSTRRATSTCWSPTPACPGSGHITSFSVEDIDRALAVNLRAPMVMARRLAEPMAARGSGHLVFVSSLSGKVASGGGSVYSATKFGLRGFAHGLREDLRDAGVGVSVVLPGFIRDAGCSTTRASKLPAFVGTKTPEDVAAAVRPGDRARPRGDRRRAARPARWAPRSRGARARALGAGAAPPRRRRRSPTHMARGRQDKRSEPSARPPPPRRAGRACRRGAPALKRRR